jgi:hypothetical protein
MTTLVIRPPVRGARLPILDETGRLNPLAMAVPHPLAVGKRECWEDGADGSQRCPGLAFCRPLGDLERRYIGAEPGFLIEAFACPNASAEQRRGGDAVGVRDAECRLDKNRCLG